MKNKEIFLFGIIKIFTDGIIFLTPLIIAKTLSPDIFASYSLSMIFVLFSIAIFITSCQTPFIIQANRENKANKVVSKSLTSYIVLFLIGIVIFISTILIFKNYFSKFSNITNSDLIFTVFAFLGLSIKQLVSSYFLGLDKKIRSAIYELFYGLISLGLLTAIYLYSEISLKAIFFVYFISALVSLLFLYTSDGRVRFKIEFNWKNLKEQFSFMKWQIVGLGAAFVINWGDNLVLRLYVSLRDIGVYNLSYQIFKAAITSTFIINNFFLPHLSKNIKSKKKINEYLNETRPKLFLLGVVFVLVSMIVVPIVLTYLYGAAYRGATTVFEILILGVFPALYTIFYVPLLNSSNRYVFIQIAFIIQMAINISLDFMLIPIFGINGAAVATLIGYCFSGTLYYFYLKKSI